MLDSKALASIPLIPANTAPPAPAYPWPRPCTSAMFLSFDVDAETAWTSKDALHAQRLITMSYGGYEARVGTPKLLELLDQLDLKATFFVTGWSVDAHPAMAEAILKAGHEIGHHGYHHLLPDPGDPWIEEELESSRPAIGRPTANSPRNCVWRWCATASSTPRHFAMTCGLTAIALPMASRARSSCR
jgi:hypothetical protein